MRSIMSKWGKHIAAIAVFLVLTVIYFSPAVFEGKVVRQGDTEKAIGMGNSQMDEYEKTAQPGEFSAWSDAMFGGMPYVSGYGNPAPRFPGYLLVEKPLKALGYMDAGMVFTGFVCFYILMCVMGVNWWLAIAGAIAFALASYNLIIIEAGHVTKAYVIAWRVWPCCSSVSIYGGRSCSCWVSHSLSRIRTCKSLIIYYYFASSFIWDICSIN